MSPRPTSDLATDPRVVYRLLALLGILALAAALVVPFGTPAAADHFDDDPDDVQVHRYDGADRSATAAQIALDTFDAADTVLISRDDDFADALAGNYAAGLDSAPILLTPTDGPVPDSTWDALETLGATNVLLLGGTAAISAGVAQAFADEDYAVDRVSGANRYETAHEIALAGEGDVGELSVRPDFPGWHNTFDTDADEWVGSETEGPTGWCGSITHFEDGEGPVDPSVGGGYALAEGGECNDFYSDPDVFGPDFRSGPYAPFTPVAEAWPRGGYVMELDAYLDADDEPEYFQYNAISLLDVRAEEGLVPSIRYFETPVATTEEGTVTVFDHEVEADGWHTFRHEFTEAEDGELVVTFKLVHDGAVVFTHEIEETGFFEPEPTDSFEAENVGSAYIWLHMDEGEQLAIDDYLVAEAFPGWHNTFDNDADEWVGSEMEGPVGWCGSITHFEAGEGPTDPSVGGGYAVAERGECNDFYADIFGEDFQSGPYAPFTPTGEAWPRGGYVMELAHYLDPAEEPDYVQFNAIYHLDADPEADEPPLRYFETPVTTEEGTVTVFDHEVDEAGWYTFRHEFTEGDDGELVVTFHLLRDGEVVGTTEMTHTAGAPFGDGAPASDFDVENVGSAYIWLHLEETEELAIDDYLVDVLDPVVQERRTAILARGDDFPDALVAGGIAYGESLPVLLTLPGELPEATLDALADETLGIQHVIVSGGSAAISDAVVDEIDAQIGITTERVFGPRRTSTATEWADFAIERLGWSAEHVNLSRGDLFPDALTMGPHMGEESAAMILTPNPTSLDASGDVDDPSYRSASQWLEDHACVIANMHVAGGDSAVSDGVVDEATEAATCPISPN